MNFWKTVLIGTVPVATLLGFYALTDPMETSLLFRFIGVIFGLGLGLTISAIIVGWAYAVYLLLDNENSWYHLFAVLTTGLIGILILIGVRWAYHKLGLTIFD